METDALAGDGLEAIDGYQFRENAARDGREGEVHPLGTGITKHLDRSPELVLELGAADSTGERPESVTTRRRCADPRRVSYTIRGHVRPLTTAAGGGRSDNSIVTPSGSST